jgi:hypothetical protein
VATPEEIRLLAHLLLSEVALVAVVGRHTADQVEMLVGLTGAKLKVSQISQLQELHPMVRTSLHMETPAVSRTHME